jgi:hypothetical protein
MESGSLKSSTSGIMVDLIWDVQGVKENKCEFRTSYTLLLHSESISSVTKLFEWDINVWNSYQLLGESVSKEGLNSIVIDYRIF